MTLLSGTMTPIYTTTVGAGGQASIQFSNIPQTYTDLKIVLSGRTTNASLADSVYLSFNSSTSNFSSIVLYGDGTSGSSFLQARYAGSQPGSTATASIFSNIEIYISNYTSSNNKPYSVEAISDNNGTTGYLYAAGGLWSNSAAISSITLTPNAGTFLQHTTATLYGVKSYVGETGGKAIGGVVTSDASYWYHTFTSSGMFTPTQNLTNVDYLVVAGGGGSGYQISGGGGAGGVRCTVDATGGGGSLPAKASFTNGINYTVLVGAGGAVGISGSGSSGGSSSISGSGFSTISCTGGGGSGWYDSADASQSGGSGAGGAATAGGSTRTGGAGTANEGFAGGNGTNIGAPPYQAGSGGGAGAAGKNSNNASGTGGNGIQTSISGTATYYGGGGGAASYNPPNGWAGGLGGGGTGNSSGGGTGTNATANTGGGGGGNGIPGSGNAVGSGGSGIVIIRYAK